MAEENLPDIEVARYALRTFTTTDKLGSLTQGQGGWVNGACEAVCRRGAGHDAPDGRCFCGIYGTLTLADLTRQFEWFADQLVTVIAAEGKTIIGDTGLRTAAARVVAYWSPKRHVRKVCKKDCPDAKCFRDLDEMLAAYKLPRGRLAPVVKTEGISPTAAKMMEDYIEKAGGSHTYFSLYCDGQLVAGPVKTPLDRGARMRAWPSPLVARWDSVTFGVDAPGGKYGLALSPTPDGPPFDRVDLGHFTFTWSGHLVVHPTYAIR